MPAPLAQHVYGALVLAMGAGMAGCQAAEQSQLDLKSGDLVVIFSVDPTGRVMEARHAFAGEALPEVSRDPEERSYAAVLPLLHRVDPAGRPLSPEDLVGLEVGAGPLPSGGCGRCLFEAQAPPMIAHPGSVCAIPKFVELMPLGEAPAANFPGRPWLSFGGPCPCLDEPPPESSPERDYRLVEPAGFWAPQALALSDQGRLGIFSEDQVAVIEPGGERFEAPGPFVGPIQAAAAAPDGSFWVYSHEQDGSAQSRLDRIELDAGGLRIAESWPEQPLWPYGWRRFEGELHAAGQDGADRPVWSICGLAAGTTDCTAIKSGIFAVDNDSFLDTGILNDGTQVVAAERALLVVGRRPLASERPVLNESGPNFGHLATPSGPVPWRFYPINLEVLDNNLAGAHLRRLVPFDDGLLICAELGRNSTLLYAQVPSGAAVEDRPPTIERLGATRSGTCERLDPAPDQPGVVRMSTSLGIYEIGPNRRVVRQPPADPPLAYVQSDGPDWRAAVVEGGAVQRITPNGATELVHGIPVRPEPVVAVLGGGGEFWVVEAHRVRKVVAQGGGLVPSTPRSLGALTGTISAAALAHDRSIWLAVEPGELWVLPADGGPPTPRGLAGLAAAGVILRLAELAPERWLALTGNDQLLILGDGVRVPERIDDDPSTEAIEVERPNAEYRGISASGGVGWVVGDGAEAFRVHPYADPPRLERLSFARASQQQYRAENGRTPPFLSAALATCPDRVYIASASNDFTVDERGVLWLLAPERTFWDPPPGQAPLAFGGLSLRDVVQGNRLSKVKAGRPLVLLPGLDRLDLVFQNGPGGGGSTHGLGESVRTRFVDLPTGAASDGEVVLVGSQEGRLYLQGPPHP
ncbi:MAG: hypothetical protein IPG45_19880 [Deltaproteobacteria bacterium]|nr:hypothetical protein [Deltaproteobacteria bacterium]